MPGTAITSLGCLTDDVLVELIEKRLPPGVVLNIHRHAADCPPCNTLLVELVRGSSPEGEADTVAAPNAVRLARLAPGPDPMTGAWAPPPEFDEFRLMRSLGHGGMGVVYLARDTSLDRLVAIKFIASPQPSELARAHFTTEARAIARLKHPNVVTVFRVGEVAGRPYLVSEYILGQRLADMARPLPWRRVLTFGLGLARGLAAAHRQEVLHRDIKPSNVIISSDGEVKLLDFGLAEFIDEAARISPATGRGIAGTPRYMAPEVLRGQPATPQSDIYSLGLVLYELCTGQLPRRQRPHEHMPEGESAMAGPDISQHPGPLTDLVSLVPGLDPDFAALIERCITEDPTERFVSAETLEEALRRLEQPAATQPLPAGNPYRGLHPFEAENRAFFFGRDGDIRAVLERLRREPLVLVAGDSGIGKSSLCRAGIVPRVTEGVLDERRPFSTTTLWPGRRPLEALAAALAPTLEMKEEELGAKLAADTTEPAWLGRALRETYRSKHGLLLFIDQLEELLTLSEPTEAARFAEILIQLALPASGVRVLLAVRGDFLTRLAVFPGLGEGIQRALYLLRPLSPEGVREAIVGPARSRGVVFESQALVDTLVDATAKAAGSLPLLQFALAELWEVRDQGGGRITQEALEEIGGVAGALSRHAAGVLKRLGPGELQAARRLLVRLVTGEGTRIACTEIELGVTDNDARAALRGLVEGRLLYAMPAGGSATYQIAHEALIERWGTLRGWLDEDIGHRAIRQRIEAASVEWERLDRTNEALWSARQLAETLPLDQALLGPSEQAFLLASRRAGRRQRALRWLAALAAPLLVGMIYGGLRLQEYATKQRFITRLVDTAQAAFTKGRAHSTRALERREAAMALFDGRASPVSAGSEGGTWEEAERVWTEALEQRDQAHATYAQADQALATALLRDSSHRQARDLLSELTYERILFAERFHLLEQRAELIRLLERLDEDGRWRQKLDAPAELRIETVPVGARVALSRYVDDHERRYLEKVPGLSELGTTPVAQALLPPGSYVLRFTLPGHVPVDLPLLAERGERQEVRIPLPAAVPAGYVYVPPGCFLFGSADGENVRQFMHSLPLHRVCLDEGYVMSRTEVTMSDWVRYLDALPEGAPARRFLTEPHLVGGGELLLRQGPSGGWTYSFSHAHESSARLARLGEPFRYAGRSQRAAQDWRQFPLAGVSTEELQGYLDWLDRTGRLPGARLCSEYEWERAARGADDRNYPQGDRLLPDDANIDVTYGQQPEAYGPDAVGAHPASMSPFGVLDMAGNVLEVTRSIPAEPGRLVMRGGAWYYDRTGALIVNRSFAEPTLHDVRVGARVCASFPGQ